LGLYAQTPFRDARTKRKIKHGKERNLLVDESANLGQQGLAQQAQKSTDR
jgi:hypothetical protein